MWALWALTHSSNAGLLSAFRETVRASDEWGPANLEKKREWKLYKVNKIEDRRKVEDGRKINFALQKIYNLIGKSN